MTDERTSAHPISAANSGLWRSVTERGSHPTGSVTGCATRHEARHSPRLRLAPLCSQPRSRPGVAELGGGRRFPHSLMKSQLIVFASLILLLPTLALQDERI